MIKNLLRLSSAKALLKKLVGSAAIFGVLAVLTYSGLAMAGFCQANLRILNETELIDAAARLAMASNTGHSEVETQTSGHRESIPYTDLADFYRKNPNCCRLVKDIDVTGIEGVVVRIFGYRRAIVEVNYKIRYKDNNEILHAYAARLQIPVSNCGNACSDC